MAPPAARRSRVTREVTPLGEGKPTQANASVFRTGHSAHAEASRRLFR
jgi:hypothetical protein